MGFPRSIRLWATFATAGFLIACVTVGAKFDIERANQLKPGVSTIREAVELLGPAKAESTMADSSRLLQWQFVQGSPAGGRGAHLAILFDRDGKMIRITHRSKT